jgi:hypothetical protein
MEACRGTKIKMKIVRERMARIGKRKSDKWIIEDKLI